MCTGQPHSGHSQTALPQKTLDYSFEPRMDVQMRGTRIFFRTGSGSNDPFKGQRTPSWEESNVGLGLLSMSIAWLTVGRDDLGGVGRVGGAAVRSSAADSFWMVTPSSPITQGGSTPPLPTPTPSRGF